MSLSQALFSLLPTTGRESIWLPIVLHMVYNFFGSDLRPNVPSEEEAALRFASLQIFYDPPRRHLPLSSAAANIM